MAVNRRNFLEELIAAVVLTGAIPASGLAHILGSDAGVPDPGDGDHDSHEFWSNFFEPPGPKAR